MTRRCYAPADLGNSAAGQVFGLSRTDVRSVDVIRRIAKGIWPSKTAAELAMRTGMTTRACEHWLEGRCGLSADALTRLLRSDAGLDMLAGLMADAKPKWWKAFRRQCELAELRRLQEQQRRAIERLETEAGD